MAALWMRMRRFVGPWGAGVLAFLLLVSVVLLWSGSGAVGGVLRQLLVIGTIYMVLAIPFAVVAVFGYRRSAATQPVDAVLPRALADLRACLILRSFGRDGHVVLPRALLRGRTGLPGGTTPNVTMEQAVSTGATRASVRTYSIVDQSVRLAPPGPTFMRVPDDRWRDVVERLIRRAHVLVLLLGPDQDIRPGFAWEIERIVASGRASRVVIVLPAPELDEDVHRAALHRACVLLVALRGAGRPDEVDRFDVHELELVLPPTTLAVALTAGDIRWWELGPQEPRVSRWRRRPKPPAKTVSTDTVYAGVIVEAITAVERDVLGPGFDGSVKS